MHTLEKMKNAHAMLKEEVRLLNEQRGLSAVEYKRLRKLKQIKLWYKDKIAKLSDKAQKVL